ncbi:MAG: hypothetical protein JST28_22745 [Acidobacteria bacterium]|nr:hypothetical protein [Acidobacteriota bacterium]
MRRRLRQAILQSAIAISSAPYICAAQAPTEDVLPDAPSVSAGEASTLPAEKNEKRAVPNPLPGGMTVKQKYGLATRRIFSLQTPLKAVLVSGWEVGTGTGPDIGTNGWKPFGERVGYNAAGTATTIFFTTAFVPSLAHQDPRYFALKKGPVKDRIRWAVRSEFVGVGDDGHQMPNYANLVGLALASVAIDAFTPRDSSSYGDTAERYIIKLGVGTGLNVIREFNVFDRVKAIAHHSKEAEE